MKLIKHKEGYSLCIEENGSNSREFIANTDGMYVKHRLSKQNCDEIFGVVDVVDVIYKQAKNGFDGIIDPFTEAFAKACIDKSMELNKDKLFTEDQMWNMFYFGDSLKRKIKSGNIDNKPMGEIFDDYIQSIQQPKEIEVEIVTHVDLAATPTDSRHPDAYLGTDTGIPFLDENGCLILKKK